MNRIWSWDHCFNALALAPGHPDLAWDSFLSLFDHQDASGKLPDYASEGEEWGWATESPASPHYRSDGYWLGSIWAPTTMLLCDGRRGCGREDLARDVALRFCRLCDKSGFAECFDALTGAGQRDRAYTWTASIFFLLASDFLAPAADKAVD